MGDDASYLITGGFGGCGLATAAWLADQGARHLVLVGRRGATTRAQQRAVRALRQRGVAVHCAALRWTSPMPHSCVHWSTGSAPSNRR